MNTTDNKLPDISDIRRENLRALEKEAGGRKTLSEAMDIQYSQLTNVLSTNYSRNIGSSMARKAEKAMGKPEGWLDQQRHNEQGNDKNPVAKEQRVPLLKWDQVPLFNNTNPFNAPHEKLVAIESNLSEYAYALLVDNDLMVNKDKEKSIFPNTIIIVDPQITAKSGDFIIVLDTKKEAAALRLYAGDDLSNLAVALKDHVKTIDLDSPQYRILAVVKEAILRTHFP